MIFIAVDAGLLQIYKEESYKREDSDQCTIAKRATSGNNEI